MANVGTLEIKVKATVDERTAEACLRLVEMYVNSTGCDVSAEKEENGELRFEFVHQRRA
jgi:hypothetical protein